MANWDSTVRVVARFTRTLGDDMLNVIHFRLTLGGVPGASDMDELLVAIRDSWWDTAASVNDIRAITSNEVTLADLTAVSVDITNTGFFRQLVVAQAGSDAGSNLPPQVAAVVSHRSAIAGRFARGRTYHGGITTDSAATTTAAYPVLDAGALAALAGAWNSMDTAIAALSPAWQHVIASTVTETTYAVINRVYTAKLFTQRRRN